MKPEGALVFDIPTALTEWAVGDAICLMQINLSEGPVELLITVGQWRLFYAANLANNMTRDTINLTMKARLDISYDQSEEWSVMDINSGKVVWSNI